jgi:hypothetical protein
MMNTIFAAPIFILNLILMAALIYCLVLFIKLAHRGIRALDLYISKEEDRRNQINRHTIRDENNIE